MGGIKVQCSWIGQEAARFRLRNSHPDWEMHPDWTAAIKHLDAYNLWIAEFVMPIAFQWIEENKSEVYKDIDSEHIDDVGTVIAKAFQIVKQKDCYKRGMQIGKEVEEKLEAGTLDTSKINPVWQEVARKMALSSDDVKSSFNSHYHQTLKLSID